MDRRKLLEPLTTRYGEPNSLTKGKWNGSIRSAEGSLGKTGDMQYELYMDSYGGLQLRKQRISFNLGGFFVDETIQQVVSKRRSAGETFVDVFYPLAGADCTIWHGIDWSTGFIGKTQPSDFPGIDAFADICKGRANCSLTYEMPSNVRAD